MINENPVVWSLSVSDIVSRYPSMKESFLSWVLEASISRSGNSYDFWVHKHSDGSYSLEYRKSGFVFPVCSTHPVDPSKDRISLFGVYFYLDIFCGSCTGMESSSVVSAMGTLVSALWSFIDFLRFCCPELTPDFSRRVYVPDIPSHDVFYWAGLFSDDLSREDRLLVCRTFYFNLCTFFKKYLEFVEGSSNKDEMWFLKDFPVRCGDIALFWSDDGEFFSVRNYGSGRCMVFTKDKILSRKFSVFPASLLAEEKALYARLSYF